VEIEWEIINHRKIKIIINRTKNVISKSKLAHWAINHYIGCTHACLYCYAKYMCKIKPYGRWGSWVEIKINAPIYLKNRILPGIGALSSIVSDPYQPIEKRYELTRRVLEALDKRNTFWILTKSDLVLRDMDLLKEYRNVEVGITLNSFEKRIKKIFEPYAPDYEKRINTLQELRRNGIKNFCFISPIIPELTDVESLILETKDFVDGYWFEFLNLKGAGKRFREVLSRISYRSMEKLKSGSLLRKEIEDIVKKYGIRCEGIILHQ